MWHSNVQSHTCMHSPMLTHTIAQMHDRAVRDSASCTCTHGPVNPRPVSQKLLSLTQYFSWKQTHAGIMVPLHHAIKHTVKQLHNVLFIHSHASYFNHLKSEIIHSLLQCCLNKHFNGVVKNAELITLINDTFWLQMALCLQFLTMVSKMPSHFHLLFLSVTSKNLRHPNFTIAL